MNEPTAPVLDPREELASIAASARALLEQYEDSGAGGLACDPAIAAAFLAGAPLPAPRDSRPAAPQGALPAHAAAPRTIQPDHAPARTPLPEPAAPRAPQPEHARAPLPEQSHARAPLPERAPATRSPVPEHMAPPRFAAPGFAAPGDAPPQRFTPPGEAAPQRFTPPGEAAPQRFTPPGEAAPQRFTAAAPRAGVGEDRTATSSEMAQAKAPPQAASQAAPQAPDPTADDRRMRLALVAEQVRPCTKCVLCQERTQTVFARGNPFAELMFIGEGPGADEDAQGEPFVGAAGRLLDKMIAAMGYHRDDVYIANIVKCRPPNNRKPEPAEMEACMPYLREQLALVKPKVIVALGATAVAGLIGSTEGITRLRGKWKLYKGITPLMPTFHPAYLLRDPSKKRDAWTDLQEVMKHLGKLPQKGDPRDRGNE